MIEYYEEQLNQANERIIELEKNVTIMHENVMTMADQIKETQMFIIKLAKNQAEIAKRVSQWPYVVVSRKQEDEED